ncbi:MAG: pirin family protein [Sandaracinaceae bacterium]
MIRIRRSDERGMANHGWLRSAHTFSFAGYYDPEHMGFRALRVINEDQVDPDHGFPPHGHRDMEIVSYVLEGALEHEDSMGHRDVLRPGEVQRMSAGTGVLHSEYNASSTEGLHFLQIWLLPDRRGRTPGYEQKRFPPEERENRLRLLADPAGEDGAVTIHQDVRLYGVLLAPEKTVTHALAPGRHAWVQVARGAVTLNGERLAAGDGAAVSDVAELTLVGVEPAEVLLFDLA